MSGQTFYENVAQDVEDIFDHFYGDEYGKHVTRAFEVLLPEIVDWAIERFG